jgi:LPPG:FO 2-phospho-L-lactate transferase
MQLVLLSGGSGVGLAHELAGRCELTVVAPTTRDSWADGLKRCPDLDAFCADPDADVTYGVAGALDALGFGAQWQRGNDDEMALRIMRTELLHADFTLTEAATAVAERRQLPFRLLPLSDDRGELHVVVTDDDGRRAIHLDEHRASLPVGEPPEPSLVAMTWAVTDAVVAAVEASENTTVAVNGSGPNVVHAAAAIAERVPDSRFIDVAGHGLADIMTAVTAPR